MLVVTVEVWPGGNIRRRRVIHCAQIVNETDLAEESEYSYSLDAGDKYDAKIVSSDQPVEHNRSEGAWELVRKVLNDAHERKEI